MAKLEAKLGKDDVLDVRDLKVYFPITQGILSRVTGHVKAVDGVSFSIKSGETVGLVGESGCGKSTIARGILRVVEPTGGEVMFLGQDLIKMNKPELRKTRKELQMVFQDPYSSLNPRMTIGSIIGEPYTIHSRYSRTEKAEKVRLLMEAVGLRPDHYSRYPHQFSGGQRQRIGMARALAFNPKLIICDEPVSSLDVSIQAQILNLLKALQEEFSLTYLFISHDLGVIRHVSDRIAVMYLGQLVEVALRDELYSNPSHPYTQGLLSAVPIPDPEIRRERIILQGDMPSPSNPPAGCRFHTRCQEAQAICRVEEPAIRQIYTDHFCRCHFR